MIRVFPRKTKATPIDDKVYFSGPPLVPLSDQQVHVSCVFTWDKPKAKSLAKQWEIAGYNVKLGGPAYNDIGDEFVPGRYIKQGYTMTSRGCNNRCGFCYVWRREGNIRELPIVDGWRVLDSNLLQCSEGHIRRVFEMLKKQLMPVGFPGGLEAGNLKDWHVELLAQLTISQCYFAYDDPGDYAPLVRAANMVFAGGVSTPASHRICCYVLVGFKEDAFKGAFEDTFELAEKRLQQVLDIGLTPFAMLYRDDRGKRDPEWVSFQAHWANPTKIYGEKPKQECGGLFK